MSLTTDRLEDAGLEPDEAANVAVHETGPAPRGLMTTQGERYRVALDYVHCTHPDTGLEVVFVPGEALPEFAQAAQGERERVKLDKLPSMPDPAKKPVKAQEAQGNRAVKGRG